MEQQSKLLIKGMVCRRCVMMVKEELERLGYMLLQVELGEVIIENGGKEINREEIAEKLAPLGFGLLDNPKAKLTGDVRALVQEVYSGDFDFPERFRFSILASQRLGKDYNTISDTFIEVERRTVEQYIIDFRINKVKEFLVYTSLTLSDIAFKLNFNSAAHLSSQFKQQTGLTPSYFKEIRKQKAEVMFSEN